jgi:hypothetical protein
MVMWPKTILPSFVAGPVAANAEQWLRRGDSVGTGKRRPSRPVERHLLRPGVERHDVEQVDAPPEQPRAGGAGPVGDALHLLQVLAVVAAEVQRGGQRAGQLPALGGGLVAEVGGVAAQLGLDLRSEQLAVLHAALVGFALDVDDDPTGLVVAVALLEPRHGERVDRVRRPDRERQQREQHGEPPRGISDSVDSREGRRGSE